MVFTRHAVERYMQFHMLDRPTATEVEAREILERNAGSATPAPHRTFRGDPVWNIEALGIEVIAKREDGLDVVVTVLPPPQFRGLTPLQVEQVWARAMAVEAEARAIETALQEAERETARMAAEEAIDAERRALASAASAAAKAAAASEDRRMNLDRIADARVLRERHLIAMNEHQLLMSTLKTMRMQLGIDRGLTRVKHALRVALRCLRESDGIEVTEALARIGSIDPGFLVDSFVDPPDKSDAIECGVVPPIQSRQTTNDRNES